MPNVDFTTGQPVAAAPQLQSYDATKPNYIDPAHVALLAPGTPVITIDPTIAAPANSTLASAAVLDPANPNLAAVVSKVNAIATHVGLIDPPATLPDGFKLLTAQEYQGLTQSDQMTYMKNAADYQNWQNDIRRAAFTPTEVAYIRKQLGLGEF